VLSKEGLFAMNYRDRRGRDGESLKRSLEISGNLNYGKCTLPMLPPPDPLVELRIRT
jgi:hypothetical protein